MHWGITHAALDVLPTGEVVLVGHPMHVVAIVAPTVVEYVAAAQSVHTALPVAILYLPATQAVHEPPFGPVKPMLHVQAARAELEIGELELVGHAVHVAVPFVLLYFPATQAEHTPPSGPVKPMLQVQLVSAVH